MESRIDKVASVSVETTGFNKFSDNKAELYQIISFAIIIADATTFETIESAYGEVKWDRRSIWEPKLESVHGFTVEHLDEHGMSSEDAATVIADILFRHFGSKPVVLLGHNVGTFAYWFIKDILDKYDIDLFISVRMLDTFTLAKTLFGIDNSKDLFKLIGKPDAVVNSLSKANMSRQFFRQTKLHWDNMHE
jgi:hypothetical protein